MDRVAIVEDNEDNRVLLEALLEDEFELIQFEDGPGALAGLEGQSVALVLLDISLPGMSGSEVLQEIRARESLRDLAVVALTAHAMAGDEDRFLREGFDAYFPKPIVDEDALIGLIRRLLAGGRGA